MSQDEINSKRKRKKKKKSTKFKVIMTILVVLVFIISIGAGYFFSLLNKVDTVSLNKAELGVTSKEELKKYDSFDSIKNIALFGIDAEEGNTGRSDAMMIITIDSKHNKIKTTSVMRDCYVNIDGHGMDKLTHAYAYEGPTLAIKTLNENFGLNIEDFASVNFDSLPQIIDLLGGVEIELSDVEYSRIPGISSPGTHLLNGEQALTYSRIRKGAGDDFERTHRQRIVLSALFSKAMSSPVTSYPSILSNLLPLVQTNMSSGDILSLATKVAGMGKSTLEQDRFPRDEDLLKNDDPEVSYVKFNIETVKQKMQDYIFDDKK